MVQTLTDSQILRYFEVTMRDHIVRILSVDVAWWEKLIPAEVRTDAEMRYDRAKKPRDILNKPEYKKIEYLNFDDYEKIICKRDNWKNYFEGIFQDRKFFQHKMLVLLSLRNDIQHHRRLNKVNKARLKLHCYDILAQIYESNNDKTGRTRMQRKLGF